jgi:hypothetical protein
VVTDRRFLASFAALVLAFAAGPAPAQKTPEKIRLTGKSGDGAVLIRVPVEPYPYAFTFSKNGSSGFMSRVYLMKVEKGDGGHRYIARTLAPGRYRLDWIWQQGHWSACMESGTIQFDVKPGRIEYVGTVRSDKVLAAIQAQAVAKGDVAMGGHAYSVSHGGVELPAVEDRDDAGLQAARNFAEASMNRSGALVELAAIEKTTFGTSGFGQGAEGLRLSLGGS